MVVAVAVASYNHEQFVEECLRSIIDQTLSDIELCWVDDCSGDQSFDRVKRLCQEKSVASRFRKINLVRNKVNRGAAYSLNLAARMSNSRFISFMNSDDYYHVDRLQNLLPDDSSEELYFAFSNVMPIATDGKSMATDFIGHKVAFDAERLLERFGSIEACFLNRQIASTTGNFFVSRKLFDAVGGFTDLKYCHDWMFALQACLLTSPVFSRNRLYYYRLHPSNSFKSLGHVAEKESNEVIRSYYISQLLRRTKNENVPTPQTQSIRFWERAAFTSTTQVAERVLFPYPAESRLLRRVEVVE